MYYPGWTGTVDGRPAPVLPANLAFRAVALEPGRHVVEFCYEPPGVKAGGVFLLMTVLILMVAFRKGFSNPGEHEASARR
jgi:uncharacterized membrane protein YfhO